MGDDPISGLRPETFGYRRSVGDEWGLGQPAPRGRRRHVAPPCLTCPRSPEVASLLTRTNDWGFRGLATS